MDMAWVTMDIPMFMEERKDLLKLNPALWQTQMTMLKLTHGYCMEATMGMDLVTMDMA